MGRLQGVREKLGMPSVLDCRDFSEGYVRLVNGFLLIMSLVIMGFGGYLVANLNDTLSALELSSPAVGTVVFGVFLFFFGLCGLWAAVYENKILMFVYVIGCAVVTLCIFAAGIALLTYTSFLENVEANNLQYALEERILAYELAVFQECCDPLNPQPQLCANVANTFPCYVEQEFFDWLVDDVVGDTTCDVLGNFESDGVPLVSDTDPASCAGQDMAAFVSMISAFMEGNLQTLGTVNIVLAVLMTLLLFAACHMLWTKDKDDRKKPTDYADDADY